MSAAIPQRYGRKGPVGAETLARLLTMRDAMGITRIADITGLDRVGIPVMQVVRPFSLSNAVSQGKGGDPTAAAISALLESAEACFAERVERFDTVVASAKALGVPRDRFAKHLQVGLASSWYEEETAWTYATDLVSGSPEVVPLELVHTAYVYPALSHDGLFAASSTGLAASLAETDAVTHGLFECIERDALARANLTHGFLQRSRIDPDTIDHPGLNELVETLTANRMLVALWHAPSKVGVPVIWCQLMETDELGPPLLPYQADGSAASFDLAAAAGHAIYEAAQTRLAAISGARDDIALASYPKYPDWDGIRAHRRLLAEGPCTLDFRELAGQEFATGRGELDLLLSKLESIENSKVLFVPIDTAPLDDLSVVKILVPALQPLLEG